MHCPVFTAHVQPFYSEYCTSSIIAVCHFGECTEVCYLSCFGTSGKLPWSKIVDQFDASYDVSAN